MPLTVGKTLVLGRSDRAEIIFGQQRVSRLHGMLWWQAGDWWYRDLGSANGSFTYEVEDLEAHEGPDEDLPVESMHEGDRRAVHVGQGIILGTRRARVELLPDTPADAWAEADPMVESGVVIDDEETHLFSVDRVKLLMSTRRPQSNRPRRH